MVIWVLWAIQGLPPSEVVISHFSPLFCTFNSKEISLVFKIQHISSDILPEIRYSFFFLSSHTKWLFEALHTQFYSKEWEIIKNEFFQLCGIIVTSQVKSYNLTKNHLLYEKRSSKNEHEHVLNKTYQADDATTVYRDIYLSHVHFLNLGGKIKTSSLL